MEWYTNKNRSTCQSRGAGGLIFVRPKKLVVAAWRQYTWLSAALV